MDACDLVGHCGHTWGASFYAAYICVGTIEETIKLTIGIDGAWATMSVDTRILVLIIVESDSVGLSALQDGPLRRSNLCIDCIHIDLLLLREGLKARKELFERDSARSAILNLCESHIDICRRQLLVEKLRVFGQLCEAFAVHR